MFFFSLWKIYMSGSCIPIVWSHRQSVSKFSGYNFFHIDTLTFKFDFKLMFLDSVCNVLFRIIYHFTGLFFFLCVLISQMWCSLVIYWSILPSFSAFLSGDVLNILWFILFVGMADHFTLPDKHKHAVAELCRVCCNRCQTKKEKKLTIKFF